MADDKKPKTNEPADGSPAKSKTTNDAVKNSINEKGNLEIVVDTSHLTNPHFVMLGRGEGEKKFSAVELWDMSKTSVIGAKTIEQLLSETGIDLGNKRFSIEFSPATGEVIAAAVLKELPATIVTGDISVGSPPAG